MFAAPAAALEQRLIGAGGAANDLTGQSSAVEGDTAVVGAPGADGGRGAVFVFTRVGDAWSQTAKLTSSTAALDDRLGTSVAIDGDTIVAGARSDDIAGDSDRGSAYTFARSGPAARTETAKLTASDGDATDYLGFSVAIDGDTIVAGASGDAISGEDNRGSAYTFARTGAATRTQTAKLRAGDGDPTDRLGTSVGIDGDTIVAGAPGDDIGVNNSQGSAYTFTRSGAASRTHTGKLVASDGAAVDELGFSIAIAADTIVAGSPTDDIGTSATRGSALTFARSGAAERNETAKLTASDGAAGDSLGWSVAVAGETILAGVPFDEVGTSANQGSVYTFSRTGAGSRTETGVLPSADGAAGDATGSSVAIDGNTVLAGTQWDDVGVNANQGSAVVFFAPAGAPPGTGPGGTGAPAPARPVVRGFDFSPNRIAVGRRRTPVAALARGGRFRFRLSAAAQVKIVIQRKLAGRRRRERCVRPRPGLRRRCVRYRRRGRLERDLQAGRKRVRFSGRIGRKPLAAGTYRALITAVNAGGTSKRRTTNFKVVKTETARLRWAAAVAGGPGRHRPRPPPHRRPTTATRRATCSPCATS